MNAAFLDTHAAVLLWEGKVQAFGAPARELLATARLLVSPTVRLELQFLHEIGRLIRTPDEILGGLELDHDVHVAHDDLADVVARAAPLTWTRDPFDRLIVAHALLRDLPLVTRDRTVRAHVATAVW